MHAVPLRDGILAEHKRGVEQSQGALIGLFMGVLALALIPQYRAIQIENQGLRATISLAVIGTGILVGRYNAHKISKLIHTLLPG